MTSSDHFDSGLPEPSAEARAVSAQLVAQIGAAIDQAGGRIPFERFMEMALYQPGLGYYAAGAEKLGEAGDFVTAPELGTLFASTLAVQIAQVLSMLDNSGDVLEFGAGSGALAVTVMQALARTDALPDRYLILETSPDLRARQADRVQQDLPETLAARIEWIDRMPETFRGCVVANEVLDAMPVSRFRLAKAGLQWAYVERADLGLAVCWDVDAKNSAANANRVTEFSLPIGYCSEIANRAEAWVTSLGDMISAGAALIVDYGYAEHEYYHPDRITGTLRCHYRHRAHDDALYFPGLQDITAHVDFTAMARAALKGGMSVSGYTSQSAFLLSLGLLDIAQEHEPANDVAAARRGHEIRTLTTPGAMGESFKVIALTRGLSASLQGFSLNDRTGRL